MTEPPDPRPLPLIPILRAGDGLPDRDDLATWHEALADAVGVEVPHDLFALWLYPASGGTELIGPEALAQDELPVPLPRPRVSEEGMVTLAAIVERAGYRSVACLPIRFGPSDVGLLLVAALDADRYDATARDTLRRVAEAIAPTFSRIARQQGAAEGGAAPDLGTTLAAAWTEARSPRDFFALASAAFGELVPHHIFEVLIPGPSPGRQYRLGGHSGGPPWAESGLVVEPERLDLIALFGGQPTLLLRESVDPSLTRLLGETLPSGEAVRSLLGVRIMSSGHLAGHLLVGSSQAGAYQEEDLASLVRLGAMLGPKIDSYILSSQLQVLRKQLVTLRNAPAHQARVADMLSTTAQFAEASRRLAEETRAMLPCDRLTLAVRLSEGDRVVLVEPGEAKHWSDLPLVPITGTPLGRVLRGEVAELVTEGPKATELIVPLRVSGRTVGALVLEARGFGALGPGDVAPVQQLADLVAPYVELVRRAALLPAPVMPGWKRVS
jgi:GAF domain-containing protein